MIRAIQRSLRQCGTVKTPACLAVAGLLMLGDPCGGADCNRNGIPDEADVAPDLRFEGPDTTDLADPGPVAGKGDFDEDGDIDLVLATGRIGSDLEIIPNDGKGGFAGPPAYADTQYPVLSLVAADLDGDGRLDLAAGVDGVRTLITISWSRGDGTFEGPRELESRFGFRAPGIVAADLDGDGDLDLAATVYTNAAGVVVFTNDGGRGFITPERSAAGGGVAEGIAAGDLDGDADADLVVSDPARGVFLLSNSGRGRFLEARRVAEAASGAALVLADADADRDLDLGYAEIGSGRALRESAVVVLANDGAGAFGEARRLPTEAPGMKLHAADLDADGRVDWAVSTLEDAWVFFGAPAGVDPRSVRVGLPFSLVADLDGDGIADLAYGPGRYVQVLRNDGRGRLGPPFRPAAAGAPFTAAAAWDFDGDGSLDWVVARATGETESHLNMGSFTWDLAATMPDLGSGLERVAPGDFDGDGREDIITWSASERMLSFDMGDESGVLEIVGKVRLPECRDLATGDIDGDARSDVIAAASFELRVFRSGADRGFAEGLSESSSADPRQLALGDFDRDGELDVLAANYTLPAGSEGRLSLWLNAGDGLLLELRTWALPWVPACMAATDLDGDSFTDAVIGAGGAPELAVFSNNGSRGFISHDPVKLNEGAARLAAADVDLDGVMDLVVLAGTGARVRTLLQNGQGTFDSARPIRPIATDGPPDMIVAADLDGDARPDVGLTQEGLGRIEVHPNVTQRPGSRDANQNGVPDECETAFHRGDSNGDGLLNISDALLTLRHLFRSGPEGACAEAEDADDSGKLNLSDPLTVLRFLFQSGPAPAAPGPPGAACGLDRSQPGSPGDLGCDRYTSC